MSKKSLPVPHLVTPFTWADARDLPTSAWLGHIPFARWLVETLRPNSVVELGTHQGASFFAFCQAINDLDLQAKVHAVDTWEGDAHAGFYGDAIYRAVADTVSAKYAEIGQLHRTTFDSARSSFEKGTIDILHIDGLHTLKAVSHDYEVWCDTVKQGGVILFHDISEIDNDFGVWKLWGTLREKHPTFEFHHSHGLGVLGVGDIFESGLDTLFKCENDSDVAAQLRLQFAQPGQRLESIKTFQEKVDQLSKEIIEMKNSRSWKLTAPLRRGDTFAQKLFSKFR